MLAVILDRTSRPADVAGLGDAWEFCAEKWREVGPQFEYCILAATTRERLNRPSALLASDPAALRHAAEILGTRFAGELILWCNVASAATWTIVADSLAEGMAVGGRA